MDQFRSFLNSAAEKATPLAAQIGERAQTAFQQAQTLAAPALEKVSEKVSSSAAQFQQRRRSVGNLKNVSSPQSSSQQLATQPEGTFLPGTTVNMSSYSVTVERFLAEGGFAHVYLVTSNNNQQRAVLKRTLCPDEQAVEMMRNEVDTMRLVTGHPNIVTYYDSHIVRNGTGYEVFILMENCSGGTLIDYMNTRLEVRLTEPEILEIFRDILAGVHHMHYGRPETHSPLLHRDLKIENVLIGADGRFKVCDFGSATSKRVPRGLSLNAQEIRRMEEELEKVTTLQYRAPELCDLYTRSGVSEKVDAWALGVLLYKLCYYVTPFENAGKLGILNARYEIPSYPPYSRDLTDLISFILVVDPSIRPNVYQIYSKVCQLQGTPCDLLPPPPDPEFDSAPSQSQQQPLPVRQQIPPSQQQYTPSTTIIPQRRGRPTGGAKPSSTSANGSQNDLFGASTTSFSASNDPWAVPSSTKPAVNPAVIDAAFSVPGTAVPSASISFAAPLQRQRVASEEWAAGSGALSDNDIDNDDDDGGVTGLTGGGGDKGSDRYAAYLDKARGGGGGLDSDEEDATGVGARKGFEGKFFGGGGGVGGLFGGKGKSVMAAEENRKEYSGSLGVADFEEPGFASLNDDEEVSVAGAKSSNGNRAFWSTQDAPKTGASGATRQKPPPPPVPAKLSASKVVASEASKPVAGTAGQGAFWANEVPFEPAPTAAAGWATEDAFAKAVPTQTAGWATEAAFESAFSAQSISEPGLLSNASSVPTPPVIVAESIPKQGSMLANNPFLLADKQQSGGSGVTSSPLKKAPAPPPPARKSSDSRLAASYQFDASTSSTNTPSASVFTQPSAVVAPPAKPARKPKPLPESPSN